MLIKALYDLSQTRGLLRNVHLQERTIHVLIPINDAGELQGESLIPLSSKDAKGKDRLGRDVLMPRFPGENNGGKAFFLADSASAVLGIHKESGEALTVEGKRLDNPAKSHLHFWQRIIDAHSVTNSPVLHALIQFRSRYLPVKDGKINPDLLFLEIRQNKRGEPDVGGKTSAGEWERIGKLTFSFQVNGRMVLNGADETDILTQYWKDAFRKEAFATAEKEEGAAVLGSKGVCMVSEASDVPISRSHKPKILGIPGIGSGGYIVSFAQECPAFSSYGFAMGENAPMSEEVAASYALALQSLLDDDNSSLKIGSAKICFWAKNERTVSDFFARMLNRPDPQAVAEFLKSPWSGVDRLLAANDVFYSVTLAGNSGRVVVRHWMQQTVESARENLKKWFDDLDICPIRSVAATDRKKKAKKPEKEGMPPLAIFRLACATVREAKDISADVSGQLYRAALEGTSPSLSLLQPVLAEFQSALVTDSKENPRYPYNEPRFALLKLILNRNRKENEPMMESPVCETTDPAYNCGRLLAVFDELQAAAHNYKLEGAGVVERYYGTASSAPNSAFGILWRLHQHHLKKLNRSGDKGRGAAHAIENRITGIARLFRQTAANIPPQFPRTFTLVEQGRFALGFYQEKAASSNRREEAIKAKQIQPKT